MQSLDPVGYGAHLICAVDDGVRLEVQEQAARVDVDGADHGERIVNDDDFRMHHAADEADHAHARGRRVAQWLAAGKIRYKIIRWVRNIDAHIDAAMSRKGKRSASPSGGMK